MFDCDINNYVKRWFLVSSNLAFLLPIIYSIKLNHRKLFFEIFSLLVSMVISILYHMCDNLNPCTRICVVKWKILWELDFIFAFHLIIVSFVYSTKKNFIPIKILVLIMSVVLNSVYVIIYKTNNTNDYYHIGILIVIACVITIIKTIYLYMKNELLHELKHHFNKKYFALAITSGFVAIYCFFGNNADNYWYMHGLWHIFIAIAMFSIFRLDNSNVCETCNMNYVTIVRGSQLSIEVV